MNVSFDRLSTPIFDALLYAGIIVATYIGIQLLDSVVIGILGVEEMRIIGLIAALKIAFWVSIAYLILYVIGKYLKLHGRIIPPYTTTKPSQTDGSEYSLRRKQRLAKYSIITAIFLSAASMLFADYFTANYNGLYGDMMGYAYSDNPLFIISYFVPDIAPVTLAPDGMKPLFYWTLFSVWLPAIPLFVFLTNLMSYLHESHVQQNGRFLE